MAGDDHYINKKFNFTQKAIEEFAKRSLIRMSSAESKEKQVYGTDIQMRGLEVCVSKSGAISYVFRRKANGVSRRKLLGFYEDLSIEQARGKAGELNAAFGRGENPFEEAAETRQQLTLESAFNIYLERHGKKLRKTWQVMQQDFERKLPASLRHAKLASISHAHAEKLHTQLGEERGTYSANRMIQLLRAVYNKMKAWKLFSGENPFAGISLFAEKARERFLSEEEAGRLLQVLEEGDVDADLRDFLLLDLFTAARKSNLLSMRFDEIDFDKGTWTIPETKNGSKHVVALGGREIALLKARQEKNGSEFVFPSKSKAGHLMDVKRSWNTLRKRLGLADVTVHDLRRSLAAGMANANCNVALIKGALGHKDIKTTMMHYAHTQVQAELEARELVHARWRRAVEQQSEQDNVVRLRQAQ